MPNNNRKTWKYSFLFPNPYAPWQRGTNDNTNGLLREYIVKGDNVDNKSDNDLKTFVNKLNHRPRKRLNWKMPKEVFDNELLHLIWQLKIKK